MTTARSSSKAAPALISAGFLLAAFAVTSAFGTTLLSLSVNSLSEQAEFVFEGEVIAVEAQRSGSRGMVSTFVTFRVIDTLKGDAGAIDIELKFLGGTLNGEVLEVNGSRLPKLGERGVYFVESLSRDLINPLLGWSQGHYLISTNGGVDSMTTVDAKPDYRRLPNRDDYSLRGFGCIRITRRFDDAIASANARAITAAYCCRSQCRRGHYRYRARLGNRQSVPPTLNGKSER